MYQQFSGPFRFVLFVGVGRLIGGYAHAYHVGLAAAHYYMRTFQLAMLGAQAFNLVAKQLQTRLKLVEDFVVKTGLFVLNEVHHKTIPLNLLLFIKITLFVLYCSLHGRVPRQDPEWTKAPERAEDARQYTRRRQLLGKSCHFSRTPLVARGRIHLLYWHQQSRSVSYPTFAGGTGC